MSFEQLYCTICSIKVLGLQDGRWCNNLTVCLVHLPSFPIVLALPVVASTATSLQLEGRRCISMSPSSINWYRSKDSNVLWRELTGLSTCRLSGIVSDMDLTYGWRRGVVVSGVRLMNEVNARRARLVPGWVTVFGRVYHLGM